MDPIVYKQTITEQVIHKLKMIFNKKYRDQEKIKQLNIKIADMSKQLQDNGEKLHTAFSDFGISCAQAGKAMVQLNHVIPPNVLRELHNLPPIK